MMNNKALGRLEKIDLRTVWESESGDFTPWLADDENLKLLGDTIGIDLDLEAQEKNVGPFRADILCKDTATNEWVLIENQLERTDHSHLGQLITYAAGLEAVSVVWLSAHFTEEHRAALDWLNDVTNEKLKFFGLEVELWRIGDSIPAPKFNIISKPNDWVKSVSGAQAEFAKNLSPIRQLQLDYWAEYGKKWVELDPSAKPRKPQAANWISLSIGRTDIFLEIKMNTRENQILAELVLGGPNAKPHFYLLRSEKGKIESEFGENLEWRELLGDGGEEWNKESRITIRKSRVVVENRNDWPEQHKWLIEMVDNFRKVFGLRIKNLNAQDYVNDEMK